VIASAAVHAELVGVMTSPERLFEHPDSVLVTRTPKVVGMACVPPAQFCRLKAESGMKGAVKVSDPLLLTVATTGDPTTAPSFVTAAVMEPPKPDPRTVIESPPSWIVVVGLKLEIVGVLAR
jgi:hypothetical protein